MNQRIIDLCVLLDKKNDMYVLRHHYRHKINRLQRVINARDHWYVERNGEVKISKRMENTPLREIRKQLSKCIIAAEKNRLAMWSFTDKYRRKIAKIIKEEKLSVGRDRYNHYYTFVHQQGDAYTIVPPLKSVKLYDIITIASNRDKIKEIANIVKAERILLGGKR